MDALSRLRAVPEASAPEAVAAIDQLLVDVEREHGVRVLLAIESGSRAWGFPSPDSDYDCRFIYVRSLPDYLTPWPRRDVIEAALDGDLDVNGWDLGKALKLMLKGNAVVLEWLRSPFAYGGHARFRDELLALANRYASRERIAQHYLHLGENQRRVYFPDDGEVAIKKLFYALRPAAALRWLRRHDAAVPPMHFPTLMSECAPPAEVAELVGALILAKARTRELGRGPVPAPIRAFIDKEFARARELMADAPSRLPTEAQGEAEALFRDWVLRSGPSAV
jgi:predicted nucleotidyltransferase